MKATLLLILCLLPLGLMAGSFADFVGEWENVDPNTQGITRIEILEKDGQLIAHMWGRCHPAECDWGQTEAKQIEDDGVMLHLLWTHSFKDESQSLRFLSDGNLRLKTHTHFTDDSGRSDRDYQYTFQRGWTHDWRDASQ